MNKPTLSATPSGGLRFLHNCKCGEWGAFGQRVNLGEFLRLHAQGVRRPELMGEWTCGKNGCKNEKRVSL